MIKADFGQFVFFSSSDVRKNKHFDLHKSKLMNEDKLNSIQTVICSPMEDSMAAYEFMFDENNRKLKANNDRDCFVEVLLAHRLRGKMEANLGIIFNSSGSNFKGIPTETNFYKKLISTETRSAIDNKVETSTRDEEEIFEEMLKNDEVETVKEFHLRMEKARQSLTKFRRMHNGKILIIADSEVLEVLTATNRLYDGGLVNGLQLECNEGEEHYMLIDSSGHVESKWVPAFCGKARK